MNNLHDNIAALRKEKGLTQEELGNLVGVSMQAVSKWENGGVPDIMLLPAIADVLGVSVDALFGRTAASADLEKALAQEIDACRNTVPLSKRIFELFWIMQRAHFSPDADISYQEYQERYTCAQDLSEGGITMMQLHQDMPYAFVAPCPETGWHDLLVKKNEQTAFFSFIGQPDAYDLLVWMHSYTCDSFTIDHAADQTGVPVSRTEELLEKFYEYSLVRKESFSLNNTKTTIYSAWENPAIIPFLMFALELIHRPECFCYQSSNRCIALRENNHEK